MVHNLHFDFAIFDKEAMELVIRVNGVVRVVYAAEMSGTPATLLPGKILMPLTQGWCVGPQPDRGSRGQGKGIT
jgi:hypothetical protein